MSPVQIHVLLWIYANPTVCPDELCGDPNKVAKDLEMAGLIKRVESNIPEAYWGWETTPMANAYIEHIIQLPFPEQKWVMPE